MSQPLIITVISVIIILIFVVPALISWAIDHGPNLINTGKRTYESIQVSADSICHAKKELDYIRKDMPIEIIDSIPTDTEEQKEAKENLKKFYEGVNLTYEELQSLKKIQKWYKLRLNIDDIEKELTDDPTILCTFKKPGW